MAELGSIHGPQIFEDCYISFPFLGGGVFIVALFIKSQQLETTKMSTNNTKNKHILAHSQNGILSARTDINNNEDEH